MAKGGPTPGVGLGPGGGIMPVGVSDLPPPTMGGGYSGIPDPTGGTQPSGLPFPMPGMFPGMAGGADPKMMQKLMGMGAIQNIFSSIGEMDARKRNQNYRAPQNNAASMIYPAMMMQSLAEKKAEKDRLNQAYYGMYSPQAGKVPGQDLKNGEFVPTGEMVDRKPWENPDTGEKVNGGFMDMAPKELLPFLNAMGPEKGTDMMSHIAINNMRPKTYGQPFSAKDAAGNPVLLRTDNKGDVSKVEGYSPFREDRGNLRHVGEGIFDLDSKEWIVRPPNQGKLPTRELKVNDRVVTQEFRGGEWQNISESPRFAPREPGGPSLAQQADGVEIGTARSRLMDMFDKNAKPGELPSDYFKRITAETSATGRDNPLYDPQAKRLIEKANQRAVGNDPEYGMFNTWLGKPKAKGGDESAPPAPENPSQRRVGAIYRSPNGQLGEWTARGWKLVQ